MDLAYLKPLKRVEFYKRVLENKENVMREIEAKRRKKRVLTKNNHC